MVQGFTFVLLFIAMVNALSHLESGPMRYRAPSSHGDDGAGGRSPHSRISDSDFLHKVNLDDLEQIAFDSTVKFFTKHCARITELLRENPQTVPLVELKQVMNDFDADIAKELRGIINKLEQLGSQRAGKLSALSMLLRTRADLDRSFFAFFNSDDMLVQNRNLVRNQIALSAYETALGYDGFDSDFVNAIKQLIQTELPISNRNCQIQRLDPAEIYALDLIASYGEGSLANGKLGQDPVTKISTEINLQYECDQLQVLAYLLQQRINGSQASEEFVTIVNAYLELEAQRINVYTNNDGDDLSEYQKRFVAFNELVGTLSSPLREYFDATAIRHHMNDSTDLN